MDTSVGNTTDATSVSVQTTQPSLSLLKGKEYVPCANTDIRKAFIAKGWRPPSEKDTVSESEQLEILKKFAWEILEIKKALGPNRDLCISNGVFDDIAAPLRGLEL